MAKSTFLSLCQTTHLECGLSGAGPAAVTGQSGMSANIVRWVQASVLEIEGRWFDWDFLWVGSWTSPTVIGNQNIAAPVDIGVWDGDSFYLDSSLATHSKLTSIGYNEWRANYRQGVKTNQRPTLVAILPDQALKLEAPPDAIYTLSADYWKRPVKLAQNGDYSNIPEEYERIIVARAKISYAEFDSAQDLLLSGQVEHDDLLDKLEAKYRSTQVGRRMGDSTPIIVRTE